MYRTAKISLILALCLGTASPALAGSYSAGVSDQSYKAGKYSGASNARVLANCPREYRGMYRGDLYCRKPQYQVLAQRHPSCPDNVNGMYRGNLYCFGRK